MEEWKNRVGLLCLFFVVFSLLEVRAAAGDGCVCVWGSMFIAPLELLWRFFPAPKSGNIVPCHFQFFFALSIHNEQE